MHRSTNLPQLQRNIFFADASLQKKIALILGGVLLLAFASQLSIPMQPVPLTFQSATVILIGMAFGARNGCYAIAAYLLAGFAGLPVLADFSFGPTHFAGPTAGYLLGFLPAALVTGWLAERGYGRNIVSAFFIAMLGAAIIFAVGVPVLATFVGWDQAITLGFMPFIITESVKLLAVSAIIPRLWKIK